MNKIDFAYFMEEFLNEARVDLRPPFVIAGGMDLGGGQIDYDPKYHNRDLKKTVKHGLRTPDKKLTKKGAYYANASDIRKNKSD